MLDSALTTLHYDHEKYITDTHGTGANKKCFEHFQASKRLQVVAARDSWV